MLASRERGLIDAILTHSPHGIIVSDANGKLVLHNKAAEKIWAGSATANSVAGWGQYRAFHADGRPFEATDWSMARALMNKETVHAEEVHFQRFDDTHGTLLGSSAPFFTADGEVDGALSVFVDISQAKQQQNELRVSSERYFTTLNSIGDAVISTTATGEITFLNPVAEALTRWSLDEARGKPLAEVFRIVNEQTRLEVESPVDKIIREGRVVALANHTILIGRDGKEVAIDDSGAPIFDPSGALAGVVLVFRDVTEERREEARRHFITQASALLLGSGLDYAATLSSVARLVVPTIADWCAVDLAEARGRVERLAVAHVDPAKVRWAQEISAKYPADPQSPHGVHEVLRSGKSQILAEIPHSLLRTAAVDEEHLRLILELGLKSMMIVPLRYGGKTLGTITFVSSESGRTFDLADLSFAEELASIAAMAVANARLYRDAQNANRSKDEFLATVSHELRTPLNAILGWARLLRQGNVSPDKVDRALESIERNSLAQVQLIEDLLDISRIVSGKLRLDAQPLSLAPVVEMAIDSVQHAFDAKGIQFQHLVDPHAGPISGDAQRVQQVIWNLLSNAVKFTPKGGRVRLTVERVDSSVLLTVSDTGQGIPKHLLTSIFERFQQADGSTVRVHGGLGLGLSIVRHILELHGGTIEAHSEGEGRGATFIARLPVAPFRNDLGRAFRHPAASNLKTQFEQPKELQGLTVLVVDDEADTRELLLEVLEQCGCAVLTASSAEEGLALLDVASPRVLVSDIGMPGMDGHAFIEQVRKRPPEKGGRIVAVALTAYSAAEDRRRALRAGFQMHIAKPVEPAEFVAVLANLAQLAIASP